MAKACAEELVRFSKMNVYSYISRAEVMQSCGKIIKVKWVRLNKGTPHDPQVRCRLVGQEFNDGEGKDELFAGTPPLYVVRALLSMVASQGGHSRMKVMIMDVKSAFLYGDVKREIFIELPPEDPMSASGQVLGRLNKAMYRTRDAPQIWQEVVEGAMADLRFKSSVLHPAVYYHAGRGLRVLAHVDDFLCVGMEAELLWLHRELAGKYELKMQMVSRECQDSSEAKFLNRIIKIQDEGVSIEGDPKHVQLLKEEWGMTQCNAVDTPMTKEMANGNPNRPLMQPQEAYRYRRAVARINYMAQDRADLSSASKALTQTMANPLKGDEILVKRVIRYLQKCPRCVNFMPYQNEIGKITIMVDSDWAGDAATRRPTSGGIIFHGSHLLCHWSKAQATIALSSGEAEVNAIVKGVSEGIGVLQLFEEFGLASSLDLCRLCTDSSAAKGTVTRRGSGKMKHLTTKQLWVQEAIRAYSICVHKIPRSENASDLLTHQCSSCDFESHLFRLGLVRP